MDFFIVKFDGRFGIFGQNKRTVTVGYSQEGETFLEFAKEVIKDFRGSKFHYSADPQIIARVRKKVADDIAIISMMKDHLSR